MHSPDIRVYLYDLKKSCDNIHSFLSDCDKDSYLSDIMLKSAVERQFIIIDEALNQMLNAFPEENKHFPEASRIISFRNRLTHAYSAISDDVVWGIIQNALPSFCVKVHEMLQNNIKNVK